MDFTGYIIAAYQHYFRKIELSKTDLNFFVNKLFKWELYHGPFSAYRIYSTMKKSGESMAYKNVNQKIRKMLSFGLIQEVSEGYVLHGARYYRTSLNGWFNLIIRGVLHNAPASKRAVRLYYQKNIIFQTFLSPFFKIESIMALGDSEMSSYLEDCCRETIYSMDTWEPDNDKIIGVPIANVLRMPKERQHDGLIDKLYHSTKAKFDFVVSPGITPERLAGLIKSEAKQTKREHIEYAIDYSLPKEKWSESIIQRPAFMTVNVMEAISAQLELEVKKFLTNLIIHSSQRKIMKEILAKDERFMTAATEVEDEFRKAFNNLLDVNKNN